MSPAQFKKAATKIKILAMDVDGTLTDGRLYYTVKGEEMKAFDVHDGFAITLIRAAGITPVVISNSNSKVALARAKDLGIIHALIGVRDKRSALSELIKTLHHTFDEVAFIGDDILDLGAMEICGISAAPKNASVQVRKKVDILLERDGGRGAAREFVEKLLAARGVDIIELARSMKNK